MKKKPNKMLKEIMKVFVIAVLVKKQEVVK